MEAQIINFYCFQPLCAKDLEEICRILKADAALKGLAIIAPEGINVSLAASKELIELVLEQLSTIVDLNQVHIKRAKGANPFTHMRIDQREEIVTLKRPDLFPDRVGLLSPKEFHQALEREMTDAQGELQLLDVRNYYETEIGKFRSAYDPQMRRFSELEEVIDRLNWQKDKPVYMYCTGGVRCEKASLLFREKGYHNIFQLEGGILHYLEEFPDGLYEGECFVFDKRVAVDSQLQPSATFDLCPHCGDPAKITIACDYCNASKKICQKCQDASQASSSNARGRACSKNCRYHLELNAPENVCS